MKTKKDNLMSVIDNIPQEILFEILNNPHESMIIVDDQANVLFMSKSYERLTTLNATEAIGRHISEVLPHSELDQVIKTGKTEYGVQIVILNKMRLIVRVPLKKDGKIIGAYGKVLFWHMSKLKGLYDKIAHLEEEITKYKKKLNEAGCSQYNLNNIIGQSDLIKIAKTKAQQASETNSTTLIVGESGTGKEVFAHAIHSISIRNKKPFVSINCSCIPSELAESELFGYAPGAFSGAAPKGKIGKFEMAHKGTIFLDEIGDLPLNLQVKLLRVLETMEIEKIGGRTKKVDCRVIAATNRNLEEMMNNGTFRSDLYYRLNVFKIILPPLRNISSDIPFFVHHFIAKLNKDFSKDIKTVSKETMEILRHYTWPGNVRELSNVIESAFICCNENQIESQHLPSTVVMDTETTSATESFELRPLKESMQIAEKDILKKTLKITGKNRNLAAKLLGIHRTGLHQKMKKYDLY